MGLRISRTIIEAHGGRLWATDNHPRGASFHFTLAVSSDAASLDARSNAWPAQGIWLCRSGFLTLPSESHSSVRCRVQIASSVSSPEIAATIVSKLLINAQIGQVESTENQMPGNATWQATGIASDFTTRNQTRLSFSMHLASSRGTSARSDKSEQDARPALDSGSGEDR